MVLDPVRQEAPRTWRRRSLRRTRRRIEEDEEVRRSSQERSSVPVTLSFADARTRNEEERER